MNREKLEKALGHQNFHWLIQSLRRRFERGGNSGGRMALPPELGAAEREAFSRFFGKRLPQSAQSFSLAELECLIVAGGIAGSLHEVVEALTGSFTNIPEAKRQTQEKWAEIFSEARALAPMELHEWLGAMERSGLLRRQCKGSVELGRDLLAKALAIASSLPTQGMALTELAATHTGNSHALDPGSALGLLVLRAAAEMGGFHGSMEGAESRRAIWEGAGVFCDELSASILVLNLRAGSHSLCDHTLGNHADQGEPCRLTLRELIRHPLEFADRYRGLPVYICENPTVVAAAAERLGKCSAPLLCIEGNPRTPASRVLRQLRSTGAVLRYHGDFDWEGIRIANLVTKRFGALPWRFCVEDYEIASALGGALAGRPVVADWDPQLAQRMRELGKSVHEEAILELLCEDLAQ